MRCDIPKTRLPPTSRKRLASMEFELWWLLPIIAVVFALGWIAARIDIRYLLRESRALPLSYFRGLNFLLNEQPDKAIESFIEVVKVDPQTIDLHFALGSLFRRQGEIDRAIRMHQNLLDRHDLPSDKRTTATYELAQDFHRAGLLDRAEELFNRLNGTPYEHPSLSHLISIYETEKDWPKAVAATRRMETLSLRAMRFSREAILLALPRLSEMGDLHAASDRDAGWLHVRGEAVAIGNEPRI